MWKVPSDVLVMYGLVMDATVEKFLPQDGSRVDGLCCQPCMKKRVETLEKQAVLSIPDKAYYLH